MNQPLEVAIACVVDPVIQVLQQQAYLLDWMKWILQEA
ncbi:MAG: hypothetical protein Ct9H300mP4_09920 [Gammaproteobacteria bacterium]|nr:MAG: hypothetical protein Ct9H300mP4_09920 [Gammaproteobacteria bacterium]